MRRLCLSFAFVSVLAHAQGREDSAAVQVPPEWVRFSSAHIDSSREPARRESHGIWLGFGFVGGTSISTPAYLNKVEPFASPVLPELSIGYRAPGLFLGSKLAPAMELGLEWRRREVSFGIENQSETVAQNLLRLSTLVGPEWSIYVSPKNNLELSAQLLAGLLHQATLRSAVGPESRETGLRIKSEARAAYRFAFLPRGVQVQAGLLAGRDFLRDPLLFVGFKTGIAAHF